MTTSRLKRLGTHTSAGKEHSMHSKRFRITAAAVGLILAGAAVTFGTIPTSDGTVSACYNKSGGALHVIDSAVTTCGSLKMRCTSPAILSMIGRGVPPGA